MRESIDFCDATMHKRGIDDLQAALSPMNPVAHSPAWIGTEQIMVVEPAVIEGIDVPADDRWETSRGVDYVHRVRRVKGFVQSTTR